MLGVDNRSRPTSITCQWTSAGYGLSREKSSEFAAGLRKVSWRRCFAKDPISFLRALAAVVQKIGIQHYPTEWTVTYLPVPWKSHREGAYRFQGFITSFFIPASIHPCMHAFIHPFIFFFWQYLAYILATLVWVCVRVWVNGKTIVSNTAIQARTYFITQERTRFRLWSQPRDRPARGVWLFSHVWQTCAF